MFVFVTTIMEFGGQYGVLCVTETKEAAEREIKRTMIVCDYDKLEGPFAADGMWVYRCERKEEPVVFVVSKRIVLK
jgi:hypothetical protein